MNVACGDICSLDCEIADPREIEEDVSRKIDLERFVKGRSLGERKGIRLLLKDWFEEEELIDITGLRSEDIHFPSKSAEWKAKERGRKALMEFYRAYIIAG
jgi:hypothetical protein